MTDPSSTPLTMLHRPASPAVEKPWLLVLMHGVGSNERDLFSLAPSVPSKFHVVSVRAPNVLGQGSYAWFEFTVNARGERSINEMQETASRAQVAETVKDLGVQLNVPAERVILGGFSQGGIMSLSLLLTQPQLMHGAMVMHSRVLHQVLAFVAPDDAFDGKQMWLSAGLRDQMLPPAQAHLIRERVASLPLTLSYNEFDNAHEITPDELQRAMDWLQQISG